MLVHEMIELLRRFPQDAEISRPISETSEIEFIIAYKNKLYWFDEKDEFLPKKWD